MDKKTKDGELKEVILWIIKKLTLKFGWLQVRVTQILWIHHSLKVHTIMLK